MTVQDFYRETLEDVSEKFPLNDDMRQQVVNRILKVEGHQLTRSTVVSVEIRI